MATRADVAKRAGVSASTVSYALSGERPISADTRRRIEAAMAELGYTPNALAGGLAGRRTKILALLFPSAVRGIGSSDLQYVVAAANQARDLGYHLVLWTTDGTDLAEVTRLARNGLVDGVLLMEVLLQDERVPALLAAGSAVTLIGRTADPGDLPYADADTAQLATCGIEHLVGLGHRRIALVDVPKSVAAQGYGHVSRLVADLHDAAAAAGVELDTVPGEDSLAGGRACFERLWAARRRPTAVMALSWEPVVGIVQQAAVTGVRVPQDLSVMALGGTDEFAEVVVPSVTTVCPPAERIGRAAARALVTLLAGGSPAVQELFASDLVVRDSTGPAPQGTGERSTPRRAH